MNIWILHEDESEGFADFIAGKRVIIEVLDSGELHIRVEASALSMVLIGVPVEVVSERKPS